MTGNNDLPPDFWEQLQKKYRALSHGEDSWNQESPILQAIVPVLSRALRPRYVMQEPIGVGGVGIVLKLVDTNIDAPRALKFPRPREGRESLFAQVIRDEISQLQEVSHPNIVEIYLQDEVTSESLDLRCPDNRLPYYIMQFVPGGIDGLAYFESVNRSTDDVVQVFGDIARGVTHLHENDIVHLDMKLENVLVSSDGRAVLSDLGSARRLHGPDDKTLVIFTRPWAHPDLIGLAAESYTDLNRVRVPEFPREQLRKAFDLYAVGKNLFRLLNLYTPDKHKGIAPYSRKYLKLTAARLLDGRNSPAECPLGLPPSALAELRYESITEIAVDIAKITGTYQVNKQVPELDTHCEGSIQSSSLSTTPLTPRLRALTSHEAFKRLGGVSQLGFINLVYPTATHSRLEHIWGTFSNTVRYLDALCHDPINPFFKQVMSADDLKATLLAALCHDIGQYPFVHDLEEVEDDSVFSHEQLSIDILDGRIAVPGATPIGDLIRKDWDVEPSRVADIIRANPTDLGLPIKDRILHTVIDGPIDADKLDYLVRDSNNLNVPFAHAIDFERLLQDLTVIFSEKSQRLYAALGIHEGGRISAETVAFARYALFSAVYWHHTSRAAKAMLHRAVWESLPPKRERRLRRTYRSRLVSFLFAAQEQPRLESELSRLASLPSQLNSRDQEMLAFLATDTTTAAQELLRMIIVRDLYKRILVISQQKKPRLWKKALKYRNDFQWKGMVELQNEFQNRLVERLREVPPEARLATTALEDSQIDGIVAAANRGSILFLIDVPIDRPDSDVGLEYLPESDRREALEEWTQPVGLEDSELWSYLHDSFLSAVGKIRVFCTPDARPTVEAACTRADLEEILDASIDKLR